MKTVRGPYQNFTTSIPIAGGTSITFHDYICEVQDHVADFMVASNPTFYTIVKQSVKDKTRSVLIVRDMGLGDVMMITPLIRKFHNQGMERIGVATFERMAPLLDNNPYITNVHYIHEDVRQFSTDGIEYDQSFDLRMYVEHAENANVHTNRIRAFGRAAEFQLSDDELSLDYFVTDKERVWARDVLQDRIGKPTATVAVVWETSTSNRNWTDLKNQEVVAALLDNGYKVVVLHHQFRSLAEREGVPGCFNASREGYSIRQSAAIMSECDIVLSPDTGFYHIASAMNKPIVAYFGSFPIEERDSHNKRVSLSVFNKGQCAAMPCRKYFCVNRSHDGTPRCIDVNISHVVSEVNRFRDTLHGGS